MIDKQLCKETLKHKIKFGADTELVSVLSLPCWKYLNYERQTIEKHDRSSTSAAKCGAHVSH